MKKLPLLLVLAIAAIGVVWFGWLRPAADDEADAPPATEVAVRVARVVRTPLRAYVTAYGTVAPEPAGQRPAASARVAPSVPGVVVAVKATEGQRVAMGQVLFELDSRAADVAVEFAVKALERQRQLIQIEGTSQKALQEAEQQLDAARVQRALLRVESPLAGTLTRVNVRPGEAVDLATVMAEVVDLERLVVDANVPSAELAALTVGRPAEVVSDASAAPVVGTLDFIGSEVDARNGTALVRVVLPAESSLRPGQFATVRVVSEERLDRLAVPVESVVKDGEGATVIAVVENDMAVQMPVSTGLRDGGLVEVEAAGLQAGALVVTEGAYGLPKETKVRILER